ALVKQECIDGGAIADFLDSPIDEGRLLVIHVDAAEAALPGFDIPRPARDAADFAVALRGRIAAAIDGWLGARSGAHVRHAVAVEETDAWVLALHVDGDTGLLPNVKERLHHTIN